MQKLMRTLRRMTEPTVKGKGLIKCQWPMKYKGLWFTITVTKGDLLNMKDGGEHGF